MQRGLVITFAASNNARERAARSEISENALGGRSSPGAWAAAAPSIGVTAKPANNVAPWTSSTFSFQSLTSIATQLATCMTVPAGRSSIPSDAYRASRADRGSILHLPDVQGL
jgi:hypothetical protein